MTNTLLADTFCGLADMDKQEMLEAFWNGMDKKISKLKELLPLELYNKYYDQCKEVVMSSESCTDAEENVMAFTQEFMKECQKLLAK